eukprot:scaffold1854_cov113-Isochrysis_galbana.AAC.7
MHHAAAAKYRPPFLRRLWDAQAEEAKGTCQHRLRRTEVLLRSERQQARKLAAPLREEDSVDALEELVAVVKRLLVLSGKGLKPERAAGRPEFRLASMECPDALVGPIELPRRVRPVQLGVPTGVHARARG